MWAITGVWTCQSGSERLAMAHGGAPNSRVALGQEAVVKLECMAAKALSGDIGELRRARVIRLEADRKAPMSERLARVHALCRQLSAIKGAARAR